MLTAHLRATTGHCLIIRASSVTVDLAGFTITGNGSGDAVTDANGAAGVQHDITVRNGSIAAARFGVSLTSTDSAVVQNLDVSASKVGIVMLRGRVEDNIVHGNAGNGIEGFESVLARGNLVTDNGGNGITGGPASMLTDNLSAGNGNGIVATGNATGTVSVASALVRRNLIAGNRGVGLTVSCPSIVVHNAVALNSGGNGSIGSNCAKGPNLGF
jgi:hypothetical protein